MSLSLDLLDNISTSRVVYSRIYASVWIAATHLSAGRMCPCGYMDCRLHIRARREAIVLLDQGIAIATVLARLLARLSIPVPSCRCCGTAMARSMGLTLTAQSTQELTTRWGSATLQAAVSRDSHLHSAAWTGNPLQLAHHIGSGAVLQGRTARVATVLMYLNDDASLVGGETAFPQVGHSSSSGTRPPHDY